MSSGAPKSALLCGNLKMVENQVVQLSIITGNGEDAAGVTKLVGYLQKVLSSTSTAVNRLILMNHVKQLRVTCNSTCVDIMNCNGRKVWAVRGTTRIGSEVKMISSILVSLEFGFHLLPFFVKALLHLKSKRTSGWYGCRRTDNTSTRGKI